MFKQFVADSTGQQVKRSLKHADEVLRRREHLLREEHERQRYLEAERRAMRGPQ